jgi:NTE family protein
MLVIGRSSFVGIFKGGFMTDGDKARRVALVIGSGSVKCAAAIGLQKALRQEGIELDMVVGCSGGSMYAAMMALGYDANAVQETTKRLWTRDVTERSNRSSLWRILLPKLFGFDEQFGLKDDSLVMQRLRDAYGERTFADTQIPLYITATDFHNGEQVVLSNGRLVDAIRASIAIPFTFKPWPVDGRLLIDGFMSDPLPVGVAIREGAAAIIALGFDSPYQTQIDSAARFALQMSSIMTNNLLKAQFAFHSMVHHSEVIAIIPEFKQRIKLFDTDKIPYIIEEGERAMNEQMPYLRAFLAAEEEGSGES